MVCEKVKIKFTKDFEFMGAIVKKAGDEIEVERSEGSLGGWISQGGIKVKIYPSDAEEVGYN